MKNKINYLQFSTLLITGIFTSFTGVSVLGLMKSAKIDSWISVIIAGIIGSIFIGLFIYIFNYEPSLPLNEKINKLFGKKIGMVMNTILFLIVLMVSINMMYNLINFIVSQFLSETPFFLVGILFSIVIIYVNIKGIETLSRTSLILLTINILLFVTSSFGLLPSIEIDNFKPMFSSGIQNIMIGALVVISFNILPMISLLIVPKEQIVPKEKYKRYFWISYIIVIILMFLSVITVIGNLGIELAGIYQYPEYIVLKRLHIFSFLDRIENFIVIQWIFGLFTTISFIVYFLTNTIKTNHKSKILPIIMTLIILYASLNLFPNNTNFNTYSQYIAPCIRGVLALFFFIIPIKIKIQKKSLSTMK